MASRSARHCRGLLASLLLVLMAPAALAQVNNPAYRDYFLVGQFGEVCTMCEVMVLCEAGETPPAHANVPATGSFTLYALHTRSFWSQVGTIWEWFISNFTTESLEAGHRRPVTIYTVADGRWESPVEGEAQVSLDPARLAFSDGREINRVDRRWTVSGANPASLGYCQRLPLWDALEVVEARTPSANPGG